MSSRSRTGKGPLSLLSISAGTKNNGFTLIEVLVAVALTALLLTALYSAFFSIAGAGATANKASVRYSQGGRFLDRFAIETRSAYYSRDTALPLFDEVPGIQRSKPAFIFYTFPQGSGDA